MSESFEGVASWQVGDLLLEHAMQDLPLFRGTYEKQRPPRTVIGAYDGPQGGGVLMSEAPLLKGLALGRSGILFSTNDLLDTDDTLPPGYPPPKTLVSEVPLYHTHEPQTLNPEP